MRLLGKELIDKGTDYEFEMPYRRYIQEYSVLGVSFHVTAKEFLSGKLSFFIVIGEIVKNINVYKKALEDPGFIKYLEVILLECIFSNKVALLIMSVIEGDVKP